MWWSWFHFIFSLSLSVPMSHYYVVTRLLPFPFTTHPTWISSADSFVVSMLRQLTRFSHGQANQPTSGRLTVKQTKRNSTTTTTNATLTWVINFPLLLGVLLLLPPLRDAYERTTDIQWFFILFSPLPNDDLHNRLSGRGVGRAGKLVTCVCRQIFTFSQGTEPAQKINSFLKEKFSSEKYWIAAAMQRADESKERQHREAAAAKEKH